MNGDPRQTVLVVDDTPDNLKLLSGLLKDAYRVKIANSGEKALAIARSEPPDLILLDIMMPGMDGFEVCLALKKDEKLREVPVIFISALHDVLDKVRAFRTGGADYVTKPFEAEEVLARVDYQIELRQLRRQLEERNHVLEDANAKLQELDQLKAGFTAMLVHDLRSPLTGICTLLDLYQAQGSIPLKLIERCQHSIEEVVSMLNDLLELFRSEGGELPMDTSPTPPSMFFDNVRDTFEAQALARGIRLQCDCSADLPVIVVDSAKVKRILSNLVGNALKYTAPGGEIHMEAGITEGGGVDIGLRWLSISVTDTGQGIPPEQLPYIFDPYRQASRKDANLGFGLGLAIVQRLMAAHRGRVSVRSQVGIGTSFTLNFPLP